MADEYISHHGIKGQKWGVEHGPPYPVKRGAGGKPTKVSIVKSRLKANAEARAAKKVAKKEESVEERHEKLKQQVIRNPKALYKNKDMFTRSEIDEIIKSIDFDRKIKDVRISEINRGLDSYARVQRAFKTTSELMSNIKNIYNIAAETNNFFIDSGKSKGKRMNKIGEKPASSN